VEFARDGVTVNAIAPGAVKIEGKTGDPRPIIQRDVPGRLPQVRQLTGRVGLPSDVAALARFLASPEACHITGVTVRVDGGAMLL